MLPGDLMLQANLPYSLNAGYTFNINAYSPDGNTNIGNFTSSFDWFYGTAPDGRAYFNARMNNFPPELCAQCFVLRISIRRVGDILYLFDKYTDVYCIDNCCTVASGISITDGGNPVTVISSTQANTPTSGDISYLDSCGRSLLRMEFVFPCGEVFSGLYFGPPKTVTAGYSGGFQLRRILNIKGTFRRLPRQITRQISRNCRVQKSETYRVYELQSYEEFPAWKMDEIESMLCAPNIYVNGVEYVYPGGDTPFRMLRPKLVNSTYAFKTVMHDCTRWQLFGCTDDCTTTRGTVRSFGLRTAANQYYDENGRLIGYTYDDLLAYFASLDGATGVTDIADPTVDVDFYKVFTVSGTGIVPSFFYADRAVYSNRIYGIDLGDTPDYNRLFPDSGCAVPVISDISIDTNSCATPEIDSISVDDTESITGTVQNYGDWTAASDGNSLVLADYTVSLNLVTQNPGIDDDGSGEVFLTNEIIGFLPKEFRPTVQTVITSSVNASIPDGSNLVIEIDGRLKWYGAPCTPVGGKATITIINLNYPL
jgi:hypothetical protein